MCNIAGYVGTKPAAPILIEMMIKQEGFNGGYYTGLTTVHDGRLHMDKVIGDTSVLIERTDAAKFPGTVGFIHSRSRSGGSVEWGHPFMGTGERISYIANGTAGLFQKDFAKAHQDAYTELRALGYEMRSREEVPVGAYTVMPDGAGVHVSDLVCQQIAKYVDDGQDAQDAIENTLTQLTSEVVGLVLDREEPNCIAWARTNFPMFIGMADHGIYMASTPHAFSEDVRSCRLLKEMSCGKVYADRFVEKPFTKHIPITNVTPGLYRECYDAVCTAISEKEMTCEEIDEVMLDILGRKICVSYPAVEYEILYDLHKQGRLEINTYRVRGAIPELTAPQFGMRLSG